MLHLITYVITDRCILVEKLVIGRNLTDGGWCRDENRCGRKDGAEGIPSWCWRSHVLLCGPASCLCRACITFCSLPLPGSFLLPSPMYAISKCWGFVNLELLAYRFVLWKITCWYLLLNFWMVLWYRMLWLAKLWRANTPSSWTQLRQHGIWYNILCVLINIVKAKFATYSWGCFTETPVFGPLGCYWTMICPQTCTSRENRSGIATTISDKWMLKRGCGPVVINADERQVHGSRV